MTIQTTTRIWREGDVFIAHAMPLDVSSSGNTPDQARAALCEAVKLFIATARENGSLDEVLEEAGHRCDRGQWIAPQIVSEQRELLAV